MLTKLTDKTPHVLWAMLIFSFSQAAMATETPKYSITETDGNIELRTYAPKIVAETIVTADYDDAGSKGFRILADYIFGNNTSKAGTAKTGKRNAADNSEKIAMTAPVIRSKAAVSTKIAMTTPVSQNKVSGVNQWRIQFVMPSKYSLQTLPMPNSNKVSIIEIPEKRYAVIRFTGRSPESKVDKKTQELLSWMKEKGLTPLGTPAVARYNPPWTPPFMRRNEVMVAY